MKRITTTLILIISIVLSAKAQQELISQKWHRFSIGGNKGYFVKTTVFTDSTMTENQFGSGGQFDNSPMVIKVAEIYSTGNEVRVITDYGDSSYYVLVFKNFTNNKAKGCMNTDRYSTIEEAKTFMPEENEFSDWYTEAGYKAEAKKPAMPEMTKKDAIAFAKFFTTAFKEIKKKMDDNPNPDKEMGGFAAALLLSTMPSNYAESKGFNAYTSIPVIERGMKKFKNDAELKKIFKDAGLDSIK
jgi:hypothetical protein